MKRSRPALSIAKPFITVLSVLMPTLMAQAQNTPAEFFRITAAADTVITEFTADGGLSWSNSVLGGTAMVECATSLSGTGTVDWLPLTSMPATATIQKAWVWNTHPMMAIPAGEFVMGNSVTSDDTYNETPAHTVSVSAFSMDKVEVSLDLWNIGAAWARQQGYDIADAATAKGGAHPVVNVSWYDCVLWCNARSERQGLTPCYRSPSDTNLVYKAREIVFDEWGNSMELELTDNCVLWHANGYRLPTEAEWEYAARGGISGARFPGPSTSAVSHATANYSSYWENGMPYYGYDTNTTEGNHPSYTNGLPPYTSPVGAFPVNGYGLSDMAGNVSEWCWDWFDGDFYTNTAASQPDTTGPASGTIRTIRGGSWANDAYAARCSGRDSFNMSGNNNAIGFRTVRRGNPDAILFVEEQPPNLLHVSGFSKTASLSNVPVRKHGKTASVIAGAPTRKPGRGISREVKPHALVH